MEEAIKFSAIQLKNVITDNWNKVPIEERVKLKSDLISYLIEKGPNYGKDVLNVIIVLLTRVVKLSWFDHPAF